MQSLIPTYRWRYVEILDFTQFFDHFVEKELAVMSTLFSLYRKFLKSSEIVYNRLEIKNDIAKERRGLRHDVVYEVFCFGLG